MDFEEPLPGGHREPAGSGNGIYDVNEIPPADLGTRLAAAKCGGVEKLLDEEFVIWYVSVPDLAELCFVGKRTVFANPSARNIAELYRLSQLRKRRRDSLFNCNKKDFGRYQACCKMYGQSPLSKGEGHRKRLSER